MNGHPRDQIDSDVASGRPTLSPSLDRLVADLAALQGGIERLSFFETLEAEVRQSNSFVDWVKTLTRYLSEFDPTTTSQIESRLIILRRDLRQRARERGWEIDPDAPARDIHRR